MVEQNPTTLVSPESALLDILWIDETHRIVKANKTALENADKNRISLIGLKHFELDPDFSEEYLDALFSGNETVLYYRRPKCHPKALCNHCEDLLAVQEINDQRLVMRCGKNIIAVCGGETDVDYPCEHTRELHQVQEATVAAKKVRSEFIANMNHEIRTPMNAIIGYAEMLAGSNLEPREKRYAEVIYRSGITLVTILNDIMDLSRIESGRLKIVNTAVRLQELLDEVIGNFSEQVSGKELRLDCLVEKNVPEVVILDGLRLKQVLSNLLSNAVKFTVEGKITLSITAEFVDSLSPATNLIISVEDTGVGIQAGEQALLNKILHPQGVDFAIDYSGCGFGLPLCAGLVSMMGGTISMSSEYGKGTRMVVTLSNVAATGRESDVPGKSTVGITMPSGHTKLLVVDDMDLIKDVFTDYFRSAEEIIVLTASTGDDAVTIAVEEKPSMIFMDLNLGGKDGKAVTRELRANPVTEVIPVIAMTGHLLEEQDYKPLFDDFLQKPFRFDSLRTLVSKYSAEKGAAPVKRSDQNETDNMESALDSIWNTELNELLSAAMLSGSLSAAAGLGRKLKETGLDKSMENVTTLGEALMCDAAEHDIIGVEKILTKLNRYTVDKTDG